MTLGSHQLLFQYFPVAQAEVNHGLNQNFPFDGRLGFQANNVIPPENLQPEKQTTIEFGAELQFFKSRFTLDVAYFSSNNRNQIIAAPIPPSSGFGFKRINAGEIVTSGVEISLDARVIDQGNFQWNSIINYTQTDSKVKTLMPGVDRILIAMSLIIYRWWPFWSGISALRKFILRHTETGRLIINPDTGLPK